MKEGRVMLNKEIEKARDWTVLFIGGASGTGKSTLAYEIGQYYGVNVMEVDDAHLLVEKVTTKENFPAIHYWDAGINWKDIGVEGNLNWLKEVSKEMMPILKALVDRHLEDQVPIILEGDFIDPNLALNFSSCQVKSIFVGETELTAIMDNYQAREGGDLQKYRAQISVEYGQWIEQCCIQNGIGRMAARPWNTSLERALRCIMEQGENKR